MLKFGEMGKLSSTNRPVRICHLAKFYPPATGGIESHLRTLAQAQARLGASVKVVCVNHLDANGRDITWKAFGFTPTVEERDGDVELLRVGRFASLFRFDFCPTLFWLRKRLREWNADIVHLHVPNPTMLISLLPCSRRQPLIITYHSDVVRQKMLWQVMRPIEWRVFRRASRILSSSPPYAEYSAVLKRYADQVHVLPFGIELSPMLTPSQAALAQAQRFRETYGQPLWLSVGRLVYYKGLSTAIEALPSVPGKLMLIGEGPLRASLEQQARQLNVADRVVFLGRASEDELTGAYLAATALWFPSNARSEAFGFAQVEAMATGCPVLNTAIPGSGVSWVSRNGESGLTVPVGDAAALAAAARRIVNEPGLRNLLSQGARRRAVEEFDATTMADRTLQVYHQTLNELQTCR